jgi:hypothetical protein
MPHLKTNGYIYMKEEDAVNKAYYLIPKFQERRSQWPRGLRRGSAAARLLRLWFRIPLGACMFVCCEFCLSSNRGLCD